MVRVTDRARNDLKCVEGFFFISPIWHGKHFVGKERAGYFALHNCVTYTLYVFFFFSTCWRCECFNYYYYFFFFGLGHYFQNVIEVK